MPRSSQRTNESVFSLRLDPALKAAFTAATEAEDKPPTQVLRDFMRAYVRRAERHTFEAEAKRQSQIITEASRNSTGDEAQVMRDIEGLSDAGGWKE